MRTFNWALDRWRNDRTRTTIIRTIVLGAVAVSGILIGVLMQRYHVPYRMLEPFRSAFRPYLQTVPTSQAVTWQPLITNLHALELATFKATNIQDQGGAIAEAAGNILIASPRGQLAFLDARYQLHALDSAIPMNMEGLRKDALYKDPLFNVTFVRTHDLLTIETGAGTYDLYASYNRFAGGCFEFAVSRISLEANDKSVKLTSGWRDVWVAKPCVPLKDRGSPYAGFQSGGRIVHYKPDKLLVSVGDHQFDGVHDSRALLQDPSVDLGKLVEVDIKTGGSRHFAAGLRNPQGLTIAPDGRIWETEHGPKGGDEVNLMVDGQHYGWPNVTYGMTYGFPPKNWPFNPKAGRHDGYTRPRFAFVPSIGISGILVPDPREFPNWADTLLVGSLSRNTLYLLKKEGDDIVYAEPTPLSGYRLRDLISLRDGRIAILADGGTLLLLRNLERHEGKAKQFEVSGLASLPRYTPEFIYTNPVDRGRHYFLRACAHCHSLSGEMGVGPPLNGIEGRRIAGLPKFGYSSALAGQKGSWNEKNLNSFILNPVGFAPGTTMSEPGLWESEVAEVVVYLKTIK